MDQSSKRSILGSAALTLLAAVTPSVLPAQQVTVPASGATLTNVIGMGELAGVSDTLRQQFLISSPHLQQLQNHQITEVWFRRDGGHTDTLQGGAFDLVMSLSETSVDPAAPSADFAVNQGVPTPTVVFSGRVTVPSSPVLTPVPWAPQNTIRIALTQSFAYSGGTLCVDLIGKAVSGQESPFWPLDYQTAPRVGTVQELGTSCSKFAQGRTTASAAQRMLVAGSTAFFDASGTANTPGLFMLSAMGSVNGLDLSLAGATGCRLYAIGGVTLGVLYGDPIGTRGEGPGGATVHLQLPADPAIMGATVYAQWAILEISLPRSEWSNSVGVSLSNGVQATISTAPNDLGLATITSAMFDRKGPVPARGFVDCRKGPVVRFLHN